MRNHPTLRLIGAPTDIGAGTRGASMGPEALRQLHHVEWRWVKGHSGEPGNERADALANRGVELQK